MKCNNCGKKGITYYVCEILNIPDNADRQEQGFYHTDFKSLTQFRENGTCMEYGMFNGSIQDSESFIGKALLVAQKLGYEVDVWLYSTKIVSGVRITDKLLSTHIMKTDGQVYQYERKDIYEVQGNLHIPKTLREPIGNPIVQIGDIIHDLQKVSL